MKKFLSTILGSRCSCWCYSFETRFEHLILFQALLLELRRYCEEASHRKSWWGHGFGITLNTQLSTSGLNSEIVENGWCWVWYSHKTFLHEDFCSYTALAIKQIFYSLYLLDLTFTHVCSPSVGLLALRLSSLLFLSSQVFWHPIHTSFLSLQTKLSFLLSQWFFLYNMVDSTYPSKLEPWLLLANGLLHFH